jgi:hypothetical protein
VRLEFDERAVSLAEAAAGFVERPASCCVAAGADAERVVRVGSRVQRP